MECSFLEMFESLFNLLDRLQPVAQRNPDRLVLVYARNPFIL